MSSSCDHWKFADSQVIWIVQDYLYSYPSLTNSWNVSHYHSLSIVLNLIHAWPQYLQFSSWPKLSHDFINYSKHVHQIHTQFLEGIITILGFMYIADISHIFYLSLKQPLETSNFYSCKEEGVALVLNFLSTIQILRLSQPDNSPTVLSPNNTIH